MKHLWEIDHPYYASSQYEEHFDSWEDFIDEWEDADEDYNMVYRVDWKEGKDHDLPEFDGNPSTPYAIVGVAYLHQRKGYVSVQNVRVCRNDEPQIIEFMKQKLEYIKALWEPVI